MIDANLSNLKTGLYRPGVKRFKHADFRRPARVIFRKFQCDKTEDGLNLLKDQRIGFGRDHCYALLSSILKRPMGII
jgi:hypothetical protein